MITDWFTSSVNWQIRKILDWNYKEKSDCLHDNCPSCGGTGVRKDGLGSCVHMISCPCPKCSPRMR